MKKERERARLHLFNYLKGAVRTCLMGNPSAIRSIRIVVLSPKKGSDASVASTCVGSVSSRNRTPSVHMSDYPLKGPKTVPILQFCNNQVLAGRPQKSGGLLKVFPMLHMIISQNML